MRTERRSILLFLDNAGCYPPELLKDKFSNIKIVFLPPNTTSKIQPLDLGVISNFKVHYRRLLLQYVLAKIDTANTATEVTKSVNILTALRWVALVWREVKATTIQKQAGIRFDVHAIVSDDEDPFNDIDDEMGMDSLISHAMGTLQHYSADEYLTGDNSLPVCVDIDGNNWDENWLNSLTKGAESVDEDKDEEMLICHHLHLKYKHINRQWCPWRILRSFWSTMVV